MSFKDVIDRFALVSSLEQEEISKWIFVINDCIKYFESMLKGKKPSEIEKSRLTNACAVYAYYKYSLYKFADNSSKFKAGDIEITRAQNLIDQAHIMWQHEKQEICDVIDFDNFSFVRVGA